MKYVLNSLYICFLQKLPSNELAVLEAETVLSLLLVRLYRNRGVGVGYWVLLLMISTDCARDGSDQHRSDEALRAAGLSA